LVAWSVAGVLLLAWLGWFLFGRVTVFEVSRQARLEVQQAARPVASQTAGRIVLNALQIGQEVKQGEILVELDSQAEQLRLREEQARLDAIPARLESLRSEMSLREKGVGEQGRSAQAAVQTARYRLQEADAAVAFARDQDRRLKEESAYGGVAKVEALRATSELEKQVAARDALAADVRRLESDALTRGQGTQAQLEELRRQFAALEGDRATVQAAIDRLTLDIDRRRIRAPVSGRLGDVMPLRAGSYAAEGQVLATIVPQGELIIVAEFEPSAVFGHVHAGQVGRMRLDGFPWTQYGTVDARVSRVGTEIHDKLVRVELQPFGGDVPRVLLQHGLPGAVEVAVDRVSPAILVLRAAGQWQVRARTP
jgi:membrane fusion protein (multidrug efflux system)